MGKYEIAGLAIAAILAIAGLFNWLDKDARDDAYPFLKTANRVFRPMSGAAIHLGCAIMGLEAGQALSGEKLDALRIVLYGLFVPAFIGTALYALVYFRRMDGIRKQARDRQRDSRADQ